MDCASFIDRLEALLDGSLPAGERTAAERHRERCAACRELSSAMAAESDGAPLDPPADMTASILERTSGSTCESAERRLCDWIDRELEPVDDELLRLHVDGCAECAALARVLARIPQDLARMAELQPDARFVDDVLARTLPRRKRFERWTAKLAAGWQGLLQRPRIAWEGAYVGTIVLVLLFGTPGSPLAAVPRHALDLARTNPVAELEQPVTALEAQVSSDVRAAWRSTSGKVAGATRTAAADVAHFSNDKLQTIRKDVGTLWSRLASKAENENRTGPEDSVDRTNGDEQ
jgi:hypothetical protein